MPPKIIRVLVVDDSVFMRSMLKDALAHTPGIEVVGSAQNGIEGLERILELKPDVVTLDVEMPGMDGLTVLKTVMKRRPLPVVMVSTKTQKGARTTLDALQAGAVDYVAKPLGERSATLDSFRTKVVRAVLTAAEANSKTLGKAPPKIAEVEPASNLPPHALVAIGISAGGPATLHKMMPAIPADFPPMVITQHMPADFTGPFADRLNETSKIAVAEAQTGDVLRSGMALIAPGDKHLRVLKRGMQYFASVDDGPKVSGYRPSVDVLFESVANAAPHRAVGVVMTGMGFDGAVGLKLLKKHGARTLAQDQATSIVYGMPKAAYETGCVDRVVGLPDIPNAMLNELMQLATQPLPA
ncbi:MAG: chemotaxis response regulator protein-glutamate methylesterase [Phycisphaerae bacterium]